MTIPFTVFRLSDRRADRVLKMGDLETLMLNVGEDEVLIEGAHDLETSWLEDVEGVGQVGQLPPKPGPWAVWTGEEWTDPRTAADMEAELHARRQAAVLTKLEFLQAAMAIGFLTPAEYRQGAMGEIPAPFVPVIESLPPMDRDLAEGTWAGSTRVERLDPLILIVAQAANISDETLDLLFGVETP